MDRGLIRLGLSMTGSYIEASHDVDPDQLEPGVPLEDQAAEHDLSIGLLQWDLDAQIGLHPRFAVEVAVPVRATIIDAEFRDRQGRALPGFSSIHHRDETIAGLGDVTLGGRIGLVRPDDVPRWSLDLRLAVSQPTGRTQPDPFRLGAQGHAHQHMFFGSGTFDPIAGLETQVSFDRWRLVGWTTSRVPLYENRYGYRASRFVAGGVGASTGFGLERWAFLLQPEIYFETPARWSGAPAINSGRTSLIAATGLFVAPTKSVLLHALAKVPYFTRAQGGQLRWPFVFVLGATFSFDVG